MANPLVDAFGRSFHYLRVSVEDTCNLRCAYCLPDGSERRDSEPPLTVDETRRLIAGFAEMGFWKFRLTGGEPTLRRDIVELAAAAAAAPGARRVSLSTNGWRLAELADELRRAGVAAVNVSLDTLDPARFQELTGRGKLASVLAGIDRCLGAGFETVKVNVVLLRGINDGEIGRFFEWTREAPLSIRFIELMPTATNAEFFSRRHLPAANLAERLSREGWLERPREPVDGPARRFSKPGHRGEVGLIAPYSADFCASCNRLRVTSRGRLRLCLFADGEIPVRAWLQRDDQRSELQREVRAWIGRKEFGHRLPEGRVGDMTTFARTGG